MSKNNSHSNDASDRKVIYVKIIDLVKADYNPPERAEGEANVRELIKSIKAIGLQYPILVERLPDGKYDVIDGHRRLQSCQLLGWEKIPCLLKVGDVSKDTTYADLNATANHLSGSQVLYVYLHNPAALRPRVLSSHQQAEEVIGRRLMVKLRDSGLSVQTYKWAKSAAVHCDRPDDVRFIKKVVSWLIKHGSKMLREALNQGISRTMIIDTIDKDRPLASRIVSVEEHSETVG